MDVPDHSLPITPVPPPRQALPHNVRLLGLVSLINDVASEMIYPLLPAFLQTLQATPFDLGLIEGVGETVASLLKLWSGGRSDRASRRRGFIVLGYGLAAVSRPLIGLAAVSWQVLAARIGDRIGKGIRTAPRDALIADSTDPRLHGRAFGFHRAMDHLGAAIGPLLAAGFLWRWPDGMRTLFLLTVLPGLLVVAVLVAGLRETPATGKLKEPLHLTLRPFGHDFRLFLLALVVFTLGNSSDLFLLWRINELGAPREVLPLLWCAFHLLKSAGNWLAGRAVDRFGARPMILLGWVFYAGIYLAFALATTVWETGGFFLAYAAFYALTEPAEKAFVVRLAGAEHKGLAYGWYNFALGVAALPANLIFGAIYWRFGPLAAFGLGAGLALGAAVMLLGVRPKPVSEN